MAGLTLLNLIERSKNVKIRHAIDCQIGQSISLLCREESMPEELWFQFLNPKRVVDSIRTESIETDLMGTARRATHAALWLGAHFGHQLKGAPMGMLLADELREKFLKEMKIVLVALSEYDKHYPTKLSELDLEDAWEIDPVTSSLSPEEILAVDYRHLVHFLDANGLRKELNKLPPATS